MRSGPNGGPGPTAGLIGPGGVSEHAGLEAQAQDLRERLAAVEAQLASTPTS